MPQEIATTDYKSFVLKSWKEETWYEDDDDSYSQMFNGRRQTHVYGHTETPVNLTFVLNNLSLLSEKKTCELTCDAENIDWSYYDESNNQCELTSDVNDIDWSHYNRTNNQCWIACETNCLPFYKPLEAMKLPELKIAYESLSDACYPFINPCYVTHEGRKQPYVDAILATIDKLSDVLSYNCLTPLPRRCYLKRVNKPKKTKEDSLMSFKVASKPAVNKAGLSKLTFKGLQTGERADKETGELTVYNKLEFSVMDTTRQAPITVNIFLDTIGTPKADLVLSGLGFTNADVELAEDDDGFAVESLEVGDDDFTQTTAHNDLAAQVKSFLESIVNHDYLAKVERGKRGYWEINLDTLKPFTK